MKDNRLKSVLHKGLASGYRTAWWLTKMMFTITFLVTLLKWSGYLEILSRILEPILIHVGLDTEGALVFITGVLANIYSSIAVMTTFDFNIRTATIIAVMNLICHNLIIETIVQRKTGSNPIIIASLRLSIAILCAWILNIILPKDMPGAILLHSDSITNSNLSCYIRDWIIQMAKIIPSMFCIIITLNIFQNIIRKYGYIDYFSKTLKPLMRLFGLSEQCSFLWVVLNTLGLAYGASVMISNYEENNKANFKLLNLHAAITHSLLEDTLIYVALGLSAIWLIFPRLLLSIFVVWTEHLYSFISLKRK